MHSPPPALTVEVTYSFDAAGIITACAVKTTPPEMGDGDLCRSFPVGSQSDNRFTRNGRPVGGSMTQHSRNIVTLDP